MPVEFDDLGLRIIGADVYAIEFYDDSRALKQRIYLKADGTLNIGDVGTGASGSGGGAAEDAAPAKAQYLVMSLHDELPNARRLDIGDGLAAVDRGARGDYDVALDWGTPTIDTIQPDDSAAAGSSTNPARSDHTHGIVAAAAGTIQPDDSADEGAATSFARSDHRHAIVAAAPGANSVNLAASAEGAATSFARSDHAHNLDESITPVWTGQHQFDADIQFVGAQSITSTADNLTIAPAGDLILDPTGDDVLPATNYDINLGALAKKYLTLHAAELWVETLVAQDTIATIGGRILVGPTTVLTSDLGDGVGDTTITVKHNEMASGDRVYMEANGKVEFMSIDSAPGGAGPYTYTVTRDLDSSGRNAWYAGDAVFNTGAAGEGFIDLYSVRGVKAGTEYGPTIVGNVRNSATYNDWTEHWAIGQLNGIYGYGVSTWGVGLGEFAAGQPHLTLDSTNGIRIFAGEATVIGQWDTSGNILVGQTGAGQSNVLITAGAVQLRNNTTSKITLSSTGAVIIDQFGDAFFSAADGLLLLGPGCPITPTSWTSLRKQTATLSGAFRQTAGRWPGTKAQAVEPAGTNQAKNPIFGVNVTDFWTYYQSGAGGSRARVTDRYVVGSASCKLVASDATHSRIEIDYEIADGDSITLSGRFFRAAATDARIHIQNTDGWATLAEDTCAKVGTWEYLEATWTNTTGAAVTVRASYDNYEADGAAEIWVDACQIEFTAYATSLIWGGAGTGYAWTDAAHNSTSTRTKTLVNLNAHVALVEANDTISFVIWAQMPYDHDATWANANPALMDIRGGVGDIVFDYSTANDYFTSWIVGGLRLTSPEQTFSAGDWLQLVLTLDFDANDLNMYINGVLADNDTTDLAAPSGVTTWFVGTLGIDDRQSGIAFSEYAAFDRVLTAAEVALMYASDKPLVDSGAMDTPGLYILDGRVRIASSTTGNRIEMTPELIAGYDDSDVAQFYVSASDGKAYAGGGSVVLEAGGIILDAPAAYSAGSAIHYKDGGAAVGRLWGLATGAGDNAMYLFTESIAGGDSLVQVYATPSAGQEGEVRLEAGRDPNSAVIAAHLYGDSTSMIELFANYTRVYGDARITGGLYVGADTDPDADDVWCDGEISTDGGTTKWNLGGYTGGAPTPDGYLTVVVEGTTYRIAVDRQ